MTILRRISSLRIILLHPPFVRDIILLLLPCRLAGAPIPLWYILVMKVPQVLGEVILAQEPAFGLALTFPVGAVYALLLVLVVYTAVVPLKIGLALEGFVAGFACERGDAKALVFPVGVGGAWDRRTGVGGRCVGFSVMRIGGQRLLKLLRYRQCDLGKRLHRRPNAAC